MSVNNEDAVDSNMHAILSELKLIDEHHKERQAIYQSCLHKYLTHLNLQTEQLTKAQQAIQKRNSNISQSFESVYDSIFQGADLALRAARPQFLALDHPIIKRIVLIEITRTDLQFKKQLYDLMRDAQDKYQDAIEARKNIKKTDFKRVFTKKEADRTLINFQQNNNTFEGKVYLGTHTSTKWKPLQNTYLSSANKQNETGNIRSVRENSAKKYTVQEDILNNFMRKD